MAQITKQQIKAVRSMISNLGLNDEKDSIIEEATNNRTTSTKEMSFTEGKLLIGNLKKHCAPRAEDEAKRKMQNKILAIAHDLDWELSSGRVDMARLNGWCKSRSRLKKGFRSHTVKELPGLITQFEKLKSN